jgi:tRNA(Ile)-lysidine synthase
MEAKASRQAVRQAMRRAMDQAAEDIRARVEGEVARAVEAHALWPASVTLVAAVSGGADSLCLLGTLLALRERGHALAPAAIVVAHLDHGLRGEAGAADAHFVAGLAGQLGLHYIGERADVLGLARQERRSIEDAARRARYAFLRRVAAEVGAARICTGHTRDDQVETLLLHLVRGSGLAGLAGMAPLSGDVARPLLAVTREQTEAYCAARGWASREDPSNADPRFLRNHIRHELLPVLERVNPNLRETLARNAALIAADERYLEQQTDGAWSAVARPTAQQTVELDRAAVRAQPPALRHRVFRRAARLVAGTEHVLEAHHIDLLDGLLERGTTGSALDLPGGLRASLTYDSLAFARSPQPASQGGSLSDGVPEGDDAQERVLPVPGVVELPGAGWRVRAWHLDRPAGLEREGAELLPPFEHIGVNAEVGRAEQRVYVDADAAGQPLRVRVWRPGDRFQPMGMAHEKKLQDFFADAKVPRALRHRLPLVFGPRHLIWVAGERIDERVRLTPSTQRILVLDLEALEAIEGVERAESAEAAGH